MHFLGTMKIHKLQLIDNTKQIYIGGGFDSRRLHHYKHNL